MSDLTSIVPDHIFTLLNFYELSGLKKTKVNQGHFFRYIGNILGYESFDFTRESEKSYLVYYKIYQFKKYLRKEHIRIPDRIDVEKAREVLKESMPHFYKLIPESMKDKFSYGFCEGLISRRWFKS